MVALSFLHSYCLANFRSLKYSIKAMNKVSGNGGLSARQKANLGISKIVFSEWSNSKRSLTFACVAGIILIVSACDKKINGQNTLAHERGQTAVGADSISKPKVDIKVNRHYDSTGNLIGFDSTYTSFYSNIQSDTLRMDSLMNSFDNYFNLNHSPLLDRQFNNLFFNDSSRYPDFFHKDFFMKRYELNDLYMRNMMREMDSVKNRFFFERSKELKRSKDL